MILRSATCSWNVSSVGKELIKGKEAAQEKLISSVSHVHTCHPWARNALVCVCVCGGVGRGSRFILRTYFAACVSHTKSLWIGSAAAVTEQGVHFPAVRPLRGESCVILANSFPFSYLQLCGKTYTLPLLCNTLREQQCASNSWSLWCLAILLLINHTFVRGNWAAH